MRKSGGSPINKNTHGKENRKTREKKTFSRKPSDTPSEKKQYKKEDRSNYADNSDKGHGGHSEKKYDDRRTRSDKKFTSREGYKGDTKRPYEKQDGGAGRPIERYVHKQDGDRKKSFSDKPYSSREKKYEDRGKRTDKKFDGSDNYKKRADRPYRKDHEGGADRPIEKYERRERTSYSDKPYDKANSGGDRPYKRKPFRKDEDRRDLKKSSDRPVEPYIQKYSRDDKSFDKTENKNEENYDHKNRKPRILKTKTYIGRKREYRSVDILIKDNSREKSRSDENNSGGNGVRLNKYIANAGICSRREADTLIETGVISINGKPITKLGTKVFPGDVVKFNDRTLSGSEQHRYLLLNKPKGYLTTTDDPQERKTVMEIIKDACKERIYPVGRLDKNTSGLLLFTNDGELAKKLTHPSHRVEKVYKAELSKALLKADMLKIAEGLELDDGFIKVDDIAYGDSKKEIGVELHSGKNRIVRRIFESLGYDVVKLDRVVFAGLTKKELPRGKYRFLSNEEVNILRRIK